MKEIEREFKQLSTNNAHTQYEKETLKAELEKEKEENYTMKMTIAKEDRFDDLDNHRHQLDLDL